MEETFSKLFREIEHDIGTGELNKLVFEALIDSIEHFEIKNIHFFKQSLDKLSHYINRTQPKFAIIIDHFSKIREIVEELTRDKKIVDPIFLKEQLLKKAHEIIARDAEEKKRLIHLACANIDVQGKKIMIFDHSHTVLEILAYMHNQGKTFHVVIAEQDIEKTEENIDVLHKSGIPFEVVPAYMLSHYDEHVDMLFFGGLTLKSTYDFVMDTGSHAIISEFHLDKKPIYMFITSSKFSLWRAEKRTEVYSHPHTRQHSKKPIDYQRLKFSHDRVSVNLFTMIITDEGVFTPTELKKCYDRKFEEAQGRN